MYPFSYGTSYYETDPAIASSYPPITSPYLFTGMTTPPVPSSMCSRTSAPTTVSSIQIPTYSSILTSKMEPSVINSSAGSSLSNSNPNVTATTTASPSTTPISVPSSISNSCESLSAKSQSAIPSSMVSVVHETRSMLGELKIVNETLPPSSTSTGQQPQPIPLTGLSSANKSPTLSQDHPWNSNLKKRSQLNKESDQFQPSFPFSTSKEPPLLYTNSMYDSTHPFGYRSSPPNRSNRNQTLTLPPGLNSSKWWAMNGVQTDNEPLIDDQTPKYVRDVILNALEIRPYEGEYDERSPTEFIEQFEIYAELLNLNGKQKKVLFARWGYYEDSEYFKALKSKQTYEQVKSEFLKEMWARQKIAAGNPHRRYKSRYHDYDFHEHVLTDRKQ